MSILRWSLLLPALLASTLANAEMSAHETVQQATAELLGRLKEVKGLYAEDPEQFYGEVDAVLSPYIDFERFSRGVMAKYYRKATPEQREQFQNMFKKDLIKTYARALVEFDNERIDVLPPGAGTPPQEDQRNVDMEIHGKDGTVYPVMYTMVLGDGEWKLRNVVVNGINIGLTFRKHFQQLYSEQGRDIARVIESWSSRIDGDGGS